MSPFLISISFAIFKFVCKNTQFLLDFEEQAQETQEKILGDAKEWTRNCNAIFLSHYHADHYGLLSEAPEGTKVYATKETAELMKLSGVFGENLTKHLDIQPACGLSFSGRYEFRPRY